MDTEAEIKIFFSAILVGKKLIKLEKELECILIS